MQARYNNRQGKFVEKVVPWGFDDELLTNRSYITVEPSLRFAPFKSDFYLYACPRLAFNLNKSFIYSKGVNTGFTDQDAYQDSKMNFDNMNSTIISMQIGTGYDISVSSQHKYSQYVFSPFISFHPYFGQTPRSIETWNVTTLRIGIILKRSQEHKTSTPTKVVKSTPAMFS